ncbi:MAG: hypothetical protein KC425_00755 [Anaerolineales bacterium]|nr:hypothetical protein [Anaerolineales bacterium]
MTSDKQAQEGKRPYPTSDQTVDPDEVEEVLERDDTARPLEVVSLDIDEEGEKTADLSAETTRSLLEEAQEEAYADEIARHTADPAVREALEERQELNAGRRELRDTLQEHHATSPDLSGGDVDAAWEDAGVGEETVGGAAPTPDQDVVDELGEAMGIQYADDEPLHTGDKLEERDRHRWELNPDSAADETDENG